MKKLWVGTVLALDAVGRKAGVLRLIHKNLPCEILSVDSDSQGRFLSARLCLGNRELKISKVYAPISPNKQFFCDLTARLIQLPLILHLVGGDFNTIIDLYEDRSTSTRPPTRGVNPRPTYFASSIESLTSHRCLATFPNCR